MYTYSRYRNVWQKSHPSEVFLVKFTKKAREIGLFSGSPTQRIFVGKVMNSYRCLSKLTITSESERQ